MIATIKLTRQNVLIKSWSSRAFIISIHWGMSIWTSFYETEMSYMQPGSLSQGRRSVMKTRACYLLQLIGTPAFPTYWSLGFQLSRYGYTGTDHIREVRQRMKDSGIPQVHPIVLFPISHAWLHKHDFTCMASHAWLKPFATYLNNIISFSILSSVI